LELILTKAERKEKEDKKRTKENTAMINNAKEGEILQRQKGKYRKEERKKSIFAARPLRRI